MGLNSNEPYPFASAFAEDKAAIGSEKASSNQQDESSAVAPGKLHTAPQIPVLIVSFPKLK